MGMNDLVEELVNHRKFVDLSEEDLDEKLREEKAKNKNSIPYNVCWAEMHPGYSSLRFILSSTPRHHPIGISPNGFVWGVKTFKSLDLLLNEFKKNPRGTPSNKQVKTSRWGNKRQLVPPPSSSSTSSAYGWSATSSELSKTSTSSTEILT